MIGTTSITDEAKNSGSLPLAPRRSLSLSDIHAVDLAAAATGNVRRLSRLKKTASTNDAQQERGGSLFFSSSRGAAIPPNAQQQPPKGQRERKVAGTEFSIMYSVISEAAAMMQSTDVLPMFNKRLSHHTQQQPEQPEKGGNALGDGIGGNGIILPAHESTDENSEQKHSEPFAHPIAEAIDAEDWSAVMLSLRSSTVDLARKQIRFLDKCEPCHGTLLHLACMRRAPLSIVVALVAAHPSSLFVAESRRSRLAIHVAAEHCCGERGSKEVIDFLLRSNPGCIGVKDADGNLPLHLAASFGTDDVITSLLEADATMNDGNNGCRCPNDRLKLPLHLVCSRAAEEGGPGNAVPSSATIRAIADAYPDAIRTKDDRGRLPLHAACNMRDPRDDVIELLLRQYPESIVVRDDGNYTALDHAMRVASLPSSVVPRGLRGAGDSSSSSSQALKLLAVYHKQYKHSQQQSRGLIRSMSVKAIIKQGVLWRREKSKHHQQGGETKVCRRSGGSGKNNNVSYRRSVSPVTTKHRYFVLA